MPTGCQAHSTFRAQFASQRKIRKQAVRRQISCPRSHNWVHWDSNSDSTTPKLQNSRSQPLLSKGAGSWEARGPISKCHREAAKWNPGRKGIMESSIHWTPGPIQRTGCSAQKDPPPGSGMEGGLAIHTLVACPPRAGRKAGSVLWPCPQISVQSSNTRQVNRWALRAQHVGGDTVA